ncbi:MAG: hypothetical protein WD208_00150 [Dehalococcoidia bacterium]
MKAAGMARALSVPRWVSQLSWRPYAAVAAIQIIGVLLLLSSSTSGEAPWLERLPLDGGWTHMVYARSFGEHLQFFYNPGEPGPGVTSPLWAMTVGVAGRAFSAFGLDLPATAKLLGIGIGMATAFLVMHMVIRLTKLRSLGIFAGAMVAIQPGFAFAVVSGMEVALFAFIALWASWAYMQGRLRTAGLLLGLAVIARPEGFVLAAIVLASLVARRLWLRDRPDALGREDLREAAFLMLPPLVLGGAWVVYNLAVSGSIFPNTYLANHRDMGIFPVENLLNVLQGYYQHLPLFSGPALVVSLILLSAGGWRLLRAHRFSAWPLVMFPAVLTYVVAFSVPLGNEPWTFLSRRFLDPAIPFLVMLLTVGLVQAWAQFQHWRAARSPVDPREAQAFSMVLNLAFMAIVATPVVALVIGWPGTRNEYSWNTRNVHDVHVGMAHWVRENTPPDSRIAADSPGAIAYFADRYTYDLTGVNTSEAIGVSALGFAEESKVDYLLAFRSIHFDSWPVGRVVHDMEAGRNTILPGNVFRAYQADWEREVVYEDHRVPWQLDFAAMGLVVIDRLDPGNPSAPLEESEINHAYQLEGQGATVDRVFRTGDQTAIRDDARTFSVSEEFTVNSVPGQSLFIARRYDAATRGTINVFADNNEIGRWNLAQNEFFFGEDIFEIPGAIITSDKTSLRFEAVQTMGDASASSFYYWILTDADARPQG